MNVKVENLSSVKKKLSFEFDAERMNAEINKAYDKISKSAKIKGFRPGKVPRSLLEQYYESQMAQQVFERLIKDSYFKAIVEHKIPAVTDPRIVDSSSIERDKPFSFDAEVEVKPEVEVKGYTGLVLQKESFEPDAALIDQRLEELRASRAQVSATDRGEAKKGDMVLLDFDGTVEGVPFEGGKSEDFQLEIGSGTLIPGFEEQLEGLKVGEEKKVNVTFPENYGNRDLAGQPAVFTVRLKEIKEKIFPSLDDEFAKGFGLESLSELREKIEQNHVTQETNRIDSELRERLVQALIDLNPIEVPESLVDQQLDYMLNNVKNRFQSQGMSLEMLGMTEESFRQMYRETAVKQVQGSLLLEGVARQEEVRVEPAEIEGKLEKIAEMANAPLEAVKKFYAADEARRGLVSQVAEEKVLQFLLDKAQIEEVPKSALTKAGDEGSED